MQKQVKGIQFTDNDLGIVALGSNDYMTFHKTDIDKVVNDQCKQINKMIAHGAKNIVVMGVSDLSKTPSAYKKSPEYQNKMQAISLRHNKVLKKSIEVLQEQQDNIKKMNKEPQKQNNTLQKKIAKLQQPSTAYKKNSPEYKQIAKQLKEHTKQYKENTKLIKPFAEKIVYFDLNETIEYIDKNANQLNQSINQLNIAIEQHNSTSNDGSKMSKVSPYILDQPFSHGYIGGTKPLDIAPKYLFNDAVHPTQEAHAIVATKLHDFIAKKFNS